MSATSLKLHSDHNLRPLWITDDNSIITESFSPLHQYCQDFLTCIAEPVTRPKFIHEYKITQYSLYAAVSVGVSTESIIEALCCLCKTDVPSSVLQFIKCNTELCGKIRMIMRNNRYFVESSDEGIMQRLLNDELICLAKLQNNRNMAQDSDAEDIIEKDQVEGNQGGFPKLHVDETETAMKELIGIDLFALFEDDYNPDQPLDLNVSEAPMEVLTEIEIGKERIQSILFKTTQHTAELSSLPSFSFEIDQERMESVKKRCSELGLPLLEEYDFHHDKSTPSFEITLKPSTKLRPFQSASLSKMFGGGLARSGVIALPCGAGKTLVGITAACTMKKNCIVLCTSNVSVNQWAREFKFWTTATNDDIAIFTSNTKQKFTKSAGILITTYSMLCYSGNRAYDAKDMVEFIRSKQCGFMLLDEVHVVPAEMFRRVLTIVPTHSKLGLTATLLREDSLITNLNYLVGPKLFESNWSDLSRDGYIAKVQCAQVWCPMTSEFYREYLNAEVRKRPILYIMNPTKIQACQYLIAAHEQMQHKTLVFSDNVFALKHYANMLNKPFIYGGTSQAERIRLLNQFRFNPALNTLFISKVGDTSIDLPEANCLIQISSQFGSRRQEAQRLGTFFG